AVFAVKVAKISREAAGLEQVLATRHVFQPRGSLVPPGDRPLQVHPPWTHGHAGVEVHPRLVGVSMEDVTIDAVTKDKIAQSLDGVGLDQPAAAIPITGEGLGAYDAPGVCVCCRGCDFGGLDGSTAAGPELAHDDVRQAAGLQVIEEAVTIRLRGEHEPMF